MKEQLIHILDQSVCLSRKQMKEYLSGTMLPVEKHAVEMHLNSCPLCNMAMEGFEEHSEEAHQAIASLNSGFLKEHFDNIAPQIHLNSMAPAAALPGSAHARRQGRIQPLLRPASIAAAVLLVVGTLWYFEFGTRDQKKSAPLAMNETAAPSSVQEQPRVIETSPSSVPEVAPSLPAAAARQKSASSGSEPNEAKDIAYAAPLTDETSAAGSVAVNSSPAPVTGNSFTPTVSEDIKEPDDVTVRATRSYVAPIIDVEKPGASAVKTTESLEKSPTKNAADIASLSTQVYQGGTGTGLSIGGSRTTGTKYVIDGVQMKPSSAKVNKSKDATMGYMELGDASFDNGKYTAALQQYRHLMNTGSPRDRYQATIKAAQCYAAMGNTEKAEELLQKVIGEAAGPERRAARRTLRGMR